ncbi:5228_t:CDS:2, partial [Entrophospora sp. SA101]
KNSSVDNNKDEPVKLLTGQVRVDFGYSGLKLQLALCMTQNTINDARDVVTQDITQGNL